MCMVMWCDMVLDQHAIAVCLYFCVFKFLCGVMYVVLLTNILQCTLLYVLTSSTSHGLFLTLIRIYCMRK
jgi:hypothetical protein